MSIKALLLKLWDEDFSDQQAIAARLSSAQLDDAGAYDTWSFKAQVAHRSFWSANKARWLIDGLEDRPIVLYAEHDDVVNARVYEQQEPLSWEQVYRQSEQVYAQFREVIELFSDELLASVDARFAELTDDRPVYSAFLHNYEHNQIHLVQYCVEHGLVEQAIRLAERCAANIVQGGVVDAVKGRALYNLACFYALRTMLEQADQTLKQALAFAPDLEEYAVSDPDLQLVYERFA